MKADITAELLRQLILRVKQFPDAELLMSREQATKLDTIFINYHQENCGFKS